MVVLLYFDVLILLLKCKYKSWNQFLCCDCYPAHIFFLHTLNVKMGAQANKHSAEKLSLGFTFTLQM